MTAPEAADPAELAMTMKSGTIAELRRHGHRRDDEDEQPVAAAEAQLGEGEAGQRREEHDEHAPPSS